MTRGLADTSVFIASESGRPLQTENLPDEVAVSIITIGELRAGVLAATDVATRDRRLSTLTHALGLKPLPIDELVADAWAALRVTLRHRSVKMPVNDSWIAATAIAHRLLIVTQDADYVEIPGLSVVHV